MEQLLKILEDNARMSVEDIAAMLNKSPAEVAAMIDLARAQGIIKGYKTLVDWEKAGVNRVEAVIELNVSPKKSRGFDEIAATIASFDEVERAADERRLRPAAGHQGPDLSGDRPLRGKASVPAGRCAVHSYPLRASHLQERGPSVSGRRNR